MKIQSVTFHNQEIQVLNLDGKPYVAMRPIAENIGLAWKGQLERIRRNEVLNSTGRMILSVAKDGKNRELLCLPLGMLNGWLAGIEVNRCKPEIREVLRLYQLECFDVLYKHFMPVAEDLCPIVKKEKGQPVKHPKSERFYIELRITDNLTGGVMENRVVAKDTNHMVTGFANDLGYQILGLKMVNDPFAGKYEKRV